MNVYELWIHRTVLYGIPLLNAPSQLLLFALGVKLSSHHSTAAVT